jgi:acetate kinase
MNIFVINSGSSSIKYQLFRMPDSQPVCVGLIERIGMGDAVINHKVYNADKGEQSRKMTLPIANHHKGLEHAVQLLTDDEIGVISHPGEIKVIGHRIVHGGDRFAAPTLITAEVKAEIKKLFALAPLHNPPSLLGIEVAESIFSSAAQVAVFDTAFHQTLPAEAYRFAIPNSLYNEHHIRVYGFHGTSHQYVTRQATDYLQKPDAKLISIHLGNGCSMAAVDGGICKDTSMGLGPLAGLIMGTRSGDVDPSVIFYMVNQLGFTAEQVTEILNKQSGMLGLTGYSDMRDITAAIERGDANAQLAYEMYAYRIKKYIGAYAAVLNGLDALVFTAGVGENDALTRQLTCQNLNYLGIQLDEEVNSTRAKGIREIQTPLSQVKILVVPTNEELEIASLCYGLINEG